MVERSEPLSNFSGGQYSPHLAGRYDSPLYRYGVERAYNVIPRPQGGFSRRPGTTNIGTYKPSSKGIEFNVSPTEAYALIFQPAGDIKIIQNDSLIKTISSHGVPRGAVGLREMGYDSVRNIMVFTLKDMHPKVLRAPTTTNYDGDGSTTDYSSDFVYFDASNIIVKVDGTTKTITTDYTVTEPQLLRGQYSSATIKFVSAPSNGSTIEIIRDWEWVDYPAQDGPWEDENLNKKTKIQTIVDGGTTTDSTNGTYTGTATIKAVKKKGGAATWFDDNWVGRQIRIYQTNNNALSTAADENNWGIATITSVNTTTQIFNVTIDSDFPLIYMGTGKQWRRWRLSAWYENNYPEQVAFHEGRLYFFRDNDRWATVANDLFTMSPDTISGDEDAEIYSVTDSSAIYFKSADSSSTSPTFAISHQALHLGTNSSHLTISGVGRTAGISSTNIQQVKESSTPTGRIRPVLWDALYFVDNIRQNLYKTNFKWQTSAFSAEKVNNYDDEILYPRVKAITLLTQPFAMIWCTMDDGTVRVCTINDIDSLYSWSQLEFHADVWDIMVLKTEGDREKVYLLMQTGDLVKLGILRTCEGDTYKKINYRETKYLSTDYYHTYSNEVEDEYLTDNNTLVSAGSLDLSTLTGGKIAVDRTTYEQYVNGTGTITVDNDYEKGTPFYSDIIFRPVNITSPTETNLNKKKMAGAVSFNLWRTLDFKVKEVNSTFQETVTFRDATISPFDPPTPFTGIKTVKGIGSNKARVLQLKVYQEKCTPLNLNSVVINYDED